MDKIKFTKETNKEIYLLDILFLSLLFEKKINIAPIEGNKIKEDKIGKSINTKLKKLIKLKNQ